MLLQDSTKEAEFLACVEQMRNDSTARLYIDHQRPSARMKHGTQHSNCEMIFNQRLQSYNNAAQKLNNKPS
jgi:hypothetical protein